MIGRTWLLCVLYVAIIVNSCCGSVTILTPSGFENTPFTPTAHMAYALTSFNVEGELIKAQPSNGCELEGDPLLYKDKIILVEADTDYCFPEVPLLQAQAVQAKAVIFTGDYAVTDLMTYSWSSVVEEPFAIGGVVLHESFYAELKEIMAKNSVVVVRVTSGDRNDYETMVHGAPWITFQIFILASALAVLCYGLWKLINYVQFYGSQFSIAQICLGLQVVGTCATVCAPIVAMSHVFIRPVPDAAYVAVYSFGPAMMTFSTVLVAFYWSGLVFYKKKSQLWNRKLFIGLLAFFLVMLLLYILSGLFFGSATQIVLVVLIVIAAACGVYFVVMGGRLIHIIRNAASKVNVVSSQKRYPTRLVKMLLVTGVSIILFVAISALVLTPAYDLYLDWHAVILGLIQFFCITTFAAEITLFKNLTAKDRSGSGTHTSDKTGSTAVNLNNTAASQGGTASARSV